MTQIEKFKLKVLKDYPDAIIHLDEQGNPIACRKNNGCLQIIGCILCSDDKNIKVIDEKIIIKDIEAIPMTSIIEDDSLNPAMPALFLCPICSRIITHPSISKLPAMGRIIGDMKD